MKRNYFFILLLLLLLTPFSQAASCLTSSEEYATEVVIPEGRYLSAQVSYLGERQGDRYAAPSEYGSGLVALFKETTFPDGLSVRLQIPTEIKEIHKPYLRILSYGVSGELRSDLAPQFNNWVISCSNSQCEFEKGFTKLTFIKERSNEVALEFSQRLDACTEGCLGTCIESPSGNRCIDLATQRDIDTIIRYSELATNADELFADYRIAGTEDIIVTEIIPTSSTTLDWTEALKQELVSLSTKGVIYVTSQDIERIGSLAAKGQAGHDYRIVYDSQENSWAYYDQTSNALLTGERDCTTYASPVVNLAEPLVNNSYYLIPLVIISSGILLLLILIGTARIIRRSHKSR